jgi:two-component system LytT family sensor kinase
MSKSDWRFSEPASPAKRQLGLPVIVLAVSTLLALLFGGVSYAAIVGLEKGTVHPKSLLIWILLRFYLWAALSPVVVLLARKYHFRRLHRGRFFAIHFSFSILFSLVHAAVYLPLFWLADWPDSAAFLGSRLGAIMAGLTTVFPFGVLVYWVILAIVLALDFYQGYGQERMKAVRLQTQLAEAQLEALKMQLQPHFLFNALHSLTDLVLEDPAQATRMIARLGDFLRLTLDNTGSQLVPLSTELDYLRCYLEIEHVRFQDRLSVTFDVDPHLDSLPVPNLILQPLVENAIRYGVSSRVGPGKVDIVARRVDAVLRIEIRDDGPGVPPGESSAGRGIGLTNIRERLRCLYGDGSSLTLDNASGGGTIATIDLPISQSPHAAVPSYSAGAPI